MYFVFYGFDLFAYMPGDMKCVTVAQLAAVGKIFLGWLQKRV